MEQAITVRPLSVCAHSLFSLVNFVEDEKPGSRPEHVLSLSLLLSFLLIPRSSTFPAVSAAKKKISLMLPPKKRRVEHQAETRFFFFGGNSGRQGRATERERARTQDSFTVCSSTCQVTWPWPHGMEQGKQPYINKQAKKLAERERSITPKNTERPTTCTIFLRLPLALHYFIKYIHFIRLSCHEIWRMYILPFYSALQTEKYIMYVYIFCGGMLSALYTNWSCGEMKFHFTIHHFPLSFLSFFSLLWNLGRKIVIATNVEK